MKSEKRIFGIRWSLAVLVCLLLGVSILRFSLIAVPLERDEGEYAYAGALLLQGIPPYTLAYSMKLPGIYAAYAVILTLFGQTHIGIHFALLLLNVLTLVILFILVKKLFNPLTGILAAVCFSILSLSSLFQGIFANAEHFVVFFALLGMLLLQSTEGKRRRSLLFLGSLSLGIGFLMKQHGAAFIGFAGLYLFYQETIRRPIKYKEMGIKGSLFLLGVFLPYLLTCLFLWKAGVFEKFWYWTYSYAATYIAVPSLQYALTSFLHNFAFVATMKASIFSLAALGLLRCLFKKQKPVFIIGFFLFSLLAVGVGFRAVRPHYYILLLPALALSASLGMIQIQDWASRVPVKKPGLISKIILLLLTFLVISEYIYKDRNYLFAQSPRQLSRIVYGGNPFPESLEIAKFIKAHSDKEDTIAILGSEPQIYFYSDRKSATGYIYTYALMEPGPRALKMQKEMIQEIESAKPKFIIAVMIQSSWLMRRTSHKRIFEWFEDYKDRYYEKVGVIRILSPTETSYVWGDSDLGYPPYPSMTNYTIAVFERQK